MEKRYLNMAIDIAGAVGTTSQSNLAFLMADQAGHFGLDDAMLYNDSEPSEFCLRIAGEALDELEKVTK